MAGRGMLFADGPTACPFVALESDRDRRSDEPDPRHRCYAEPTPAPRALAHQREFCLTTEFGRCPIFQDWAIRAAARPVPLRPLPQPPADTPPEPRGPEQLPAFGPLLGTESALEQAIVAPPVAPAALARPVAPTAGAAKTGVERIPSLPHQAPTTDEPAQVEAAPEPTGQADAPSAPPASSPPSAPQERPRAKPRWADDWPPSAAGGAAGAAGGAWLSSATTPAAPSAAERRAGYIPPPSGSGDESRPAAAVEPEAPLPAFLAGRAVPRDPNAPARPRRQQQAKPSPRDEWSAQRADLIPAWERERYSAYPTIRTRFGMGDSDALLGRLTRILAIVALVTVAVALLILAPGFFAGAPAASPTASPSPTASVSTSPTATPQPTVSFGSYTVKAGDSLSVIALEFGLLPCQIQAANPEITDPNQIFIGQLIRIPPDDFGLDTCEATPPP